MENAMNKDQVHGTIKDALGKAQAHAGKTVGSQKQEAKGTLKQTQGRLQKAYGDLKEALKNSRHT
jgi:uncharacterized protein YjbJ (UPF0337 family)